MADTDVLIVGAGPTGLVLAFWLAKLGVRLRIVDKTAEPGTTSRALAVHARTLELYRQVGLADDVVERSLPFIAANLWIKGRHVRRAPLGDMGKGMSRYPYVLVFPQDEHEKLLIERLRGIGVEVERPVELASFEPGSERCTAQLKRADGTLERCAATYIAGCDGARSKVREIIGSDFPGGTYGRIFYVADAVARGPVINHELNLALDTAEFLAVFPLKGENRARLIGTIKRSAEASHETLEWKDVSGSVLRQLRVEVERINWFSTYHVHHRVARRFQYGRTFLLGDAAHIHSPVGGQGMNTGIGDAINLAWKLAAVIEKRAMARILDTYEPERIAFARRLVATTDRAFQLVTSEGRLAEFVRLNIAPFVIARLLSSERFRKFAFKTISQIAIRYPDSTLSDGSAGTFKAGDRLPWVELDGKPGADNYAPLAALDWQAHVYGTPKPEIVELCKKRGFALHAFSWREGMQTVGLTRDAVYFVRPDGYVGFVDKDGDSRLLSQYVDAWALAPRASRSEPPVQSVR
jgi:2-polyprenyl-6-methoxyphenol hydroxylase-like FAD-dependent oxidoreductase